MTRRLALVGLGHIAREAHIPVISAKPDLELAAVVSARSDHPSVATYRTLEEMLAAEPAVDAVALCGPPQVRYGQARTALAAGKHVLLEKPPGATLSEVVDLQRMARSAGTTLFASWHSRYAAGVEPARSWLADKSITRVDVRWQENVRKYHPGQQWIWQPGGLGVFDPGINALSIATRIVPNTFFLSESELLVPSNCAAPIAARLAFSDREGVTYRADFDWRPESAPIWRIDIDTESGRLCLAAGGHELWIDSRRQELTNPAGEYDGLYARFSALIEAGESEVDLAPLRHVADAFVNASYKQIEAFHDA